MSVAKARAHLDQAERVLAEAKPARDRALDLLDEAKPARDRALDLLDEALASTGWCGLVVGEALNRVRSSRSDLRDSRSALDAVPGPDGAAAREFRERGRPAGDDGMTRNT